MLVLRYSGMRIGDTVKLSSARLIGNRLFLYTQKTGTPVNCVLPEFVVGELAKSPKLSEGHFFGLDDQNCTVPSESGSGNCKDCLSWQASKGVTLTVSGTPLQLNFFRVVCRLSESQYCSAIPRSKSPRNTITRGCGLGRSNWRLICSAC